MPNRCATNAQQMRTYKNIKNIKKRKKKARRVPAHKRRPRAAGKIHIREDAGIVGYLFRADDVYGLASS